MKSEIYREGTHKPKPWFAYGKPWVAFHARRSRSWLLFMYSTLKLHRGFDRRVLWQAAPSTLVDNTIPGTHGRTSNGYVTYGPVLRVHCSTPHPLYPSVSIAWAPGDNPGPFVCASSPPLRNLLERGGGGGVEGMGSGGTPPPWSECPSSQRTDKLLGTEPLSTQEISSCRHTEMPSYQ